MRKRQLNWPEAAVALLLATLLASVVALFVQVNRNQANVLHRAEQSAVVLLKLLDEAQGQYSRSVSRILGSEYNYYTLGPEGGATSVQFPGTFARVLSDRLSANHKDATFRVYSDDPFGAARTRELDPFAIAALQSIGSGARSRVVQTRWRQDGGAVLRVAIGITMEQSCVDCHNDPAWALKKSDWKAGDIRGVRDVEFLVPPGDLLIHPAYWSFFALVVVACLLGSGVLYPALRHATRQRSHFEDVSQQLGARAKRLAQQANTDALTELSNRRFFDNVMHAYVHEYAQSGRYLGLLLFDIDHFKRVNDSHGHVVGDAVIANIAGLVRDSVRRNDCPARVGGEEFAVLCPGGDRDSLMELAGRLRRLVAGMQFEAGNSDTRFGVTVSVGVAEMTPGDDPTSLYARADKKLYEAKSSGRNQVCG